jgi:hypothetical protein
MNNARKRMIFDATVWTVSVLTALVLVAHDAIAESKMFTATHPKWKAECASCHVAYPPQLLPAAAWRRIMSGLGKHFGTDASLDAETAAEIGVFLEQNAARGKRARTGGETLRITETAWFRHEHDEVPAATWKRAGVKSAANCTACHTAADRGDFSERNIRIPR